MKEGATFNSWRAAGDKSHTSNFSVRKPTPQHIIWFPNNTGFTSEMMHILPLGAFSFCLTTNPLPSFCQSTPFNDHILKLRPLVFLYLAYFRM